MLLHDLTPEQKRALVKEIKEEEKAKELLKEEERETYKEMVSSTVEEIFPELEKISILLAEGKKKVYGAFSAIIDMKEELYGVKTNQKSHTFRNKKGDKSIEIGIRTLDRYDDTAEAGIAKIKKYIETLVDNDNAELVTIINSLLKKDDKGNLKASRVLELRKLSQKIKNVDFTDGVRILADAYKAEFSANFVSAAFKDNRNVWHSLGLSITTVDLAE